MADILRLTIDEFITATASKQPTPGGGAVAALCGALAAALGAMALEYTVGKKVFAAHDPEIRQALAHFQTASQMLRQLITEDVAAYEGLSPFLKLPTPERLNHPDFAAAVVAAIRAPQTTAGFAFNILEHCARLLDLTNRHLLSDLGIAATFAHATVHASELNVRINLPLLPNPAEAPELERQLRELSARADTLYSTFRLELLRRL